MSAVRKISGMHFYLFLVPMVEFCAYFSLGVVVRMSHLQLRTMVAVSSTVGDDQAAANSLPSPGGSKLIPSDITLLLFGTVVFAFILLLAF